jgi:hypothetical protein
MNEIDPRLVRISIEVNGVLRGYDGLALTASGTKYANANQNECEVTLSNLDKETRDFILSETSPFNASRSPKRFIVEAGRVSYGLARIYEGVIASAVPTQPPDIAVTLKALTANDKKGVVIARSQPGMAPLSLIARQVANDLGTSMIFEADDKQIGNYNYSGGALKQVDKLGEAGGVDAFIDDNTLIIKRARRPLSNQIRILNADTGLIGIPEITERGVKVKFLLDNTTVLGGGLRLQSNIYPAVNGDYAIYKLGFDIASRDTPFYWIAEAEPV